MRPIISTKQAAVGLAALSLAAGVTAASAAGGGSPNGKAPAGRGTTTMTQPFLGVGTDLQFHALTPCRLADTREAGGALNHSTRSFSTVGGLAGQGGSASGCGVPTSAVAIQANVTAVPQGQSGYLTAFAAGTPLPTASTVNHGTSQAVANAVTIPLSSADQFAIFSWKKAHVVTDVLGYYTKPLYATLTPSGTIYAGIASGVVSTSRTGTGTYTVTFDRNVQGCSVVANDLLFAGTRDVSTDPTFSPNDTVTIRVTDSNNNPSDTYFNLTATC